MKVVFSKRFHDVYTRDPAAERGRLVRAERAVRAAGHEIVEPGSATAEDAERVHGREHVERVIALSRVGPMALLAAGAAIRAARLAARGEPAFALVRPPGHHASQDSCWGFCYLDNVAIAVQALIDDGTVGSALVLDIDLHFGDGTANIFAGREDVTYLHPDAWTAEEYMTGLRAALDSAPPRDIVAVSAGFDNHVDDWGQTLGTGHYRTIGRWVASWSREHSGGRRFGVLEGGYDPSSLAEALVALLDGLGGDLPG